MNSPDDPVLIRDISERRFNAFAGWTRGPLPTPLIEEVAWLELRPGKVLGTLFLDLVDKEIWSATLAPDLAGRFRGVEILGPHPDVRVAAHLTAESMVRTSQDYDAVRGQGDESAPVDFFADLVAPDRWHSRFKYLREEPAAIAARRLIQVMMRWYENQDGNFVEQFQTSAFDARIWELYIWAMLRESGYVVEQPNPAPDFLAKSADFSFYIEATTANPPSPGKEVAKPTTPEEIDDYLHNYLPTRFSGPLVAKLKKKYWEKKDAGKHPLILAIQDFHAELSMTFSQPALYEYLYGVRIDEVNQDGRTIHVESPVESIVWQSKRITSSFFQLPDSEHVSAVMFNAGGTLTKFNRMGIAAGMGDDSVTANHTGTRYALDNSGGIVSFNDAVEEGYEEDWIDGLTVFHNPNALRPLPVSFLPGAAHVFEKDGLRTQITPSGHVVTSFTTLVTAASRSQVERAKGALNLTQT